MSALVAIATTTGPAVLFVRSGSVKLPEIEALLLIVPPATVFAGMVTVITAAVPLPALTAGLLHWMTSLPDVTPTAGRQLKPPWPTAVKGRPAGPVSVSVTVAMVGKVAPLAV